MSTEVGVVVEVAVLLVVENEHENHCANNVLTNKFFFKRCIVLSVGFKTFMVDAKPPTQTKTWLKLVLLQMNTHVVKKLYTRS